MDKAFILQQIAYHQMILNGLRQELEELSHTGQAAIDKAREAVQSIDHQISFEEFSDRVRAYAVAHSKEKAQELLMEVAGVSLIRLVDPKFYGLILKKVRN